MAAMEAKFSIFSCCPSTSPRYPLHQRPLSSFKLPVSTSTVPFPLQCPLHPLSPVLSRKPSFKICSTVEEAVAVAEEEEKTEPTQQIDQRRKLFVLNLPWSFTVADIKKVFGECGSVTDVEIIKQKDGKNRGFAFVTMASGEEARAAIEKFDSFCVKTLAYFSLLPSPHRNAAILVKTPQSNFATRSLKREELSDRIIRVELAKRFRKPSPSNPEPPSEPPSREEAPHVLYASNLSWKVRSSHLREFFSGNNPVSSRVVFESGRSAGYGFVSFATKEQAEAAISSLEGKELLGRPVRLKFSIKNAEKSENKAEGTSEEQPGDQ